MASIACINHNSQLGANFVQPQHIDCAKSSVAREPIEAVVLFQSARFAVLQKKQHDMQRARFIARQEAGMRDFAIACSRGEA